ncbi:DNA-binding response regulator [Aphanothece hegewaldii CCALA 016]|uniref:DNA-binding response regulator n=1 Tax=Aphanothece hegewaldii CCALA 016 TaxID=2107694 RepID=A0A2T1LUX9_9CHRO|nr:two-component system response regulator RppA [Aphanothece hegewaldii]PSF35436.1 DNA-binding response regulator [Aphanothece hegewaldii CCALA 016]
MKILLVDDETELTEPLSHVLSQEGYHVEIADNGTDGLNLAQQNNYDLIILDWMLPYQSGVEICSSIRNQGNLTPVLILTAKDTIDDRVLGLDAGADDYIVKPFELRELLARIRALLRRSPNDPANNNGKLKIADLELDPDNQMAYRQGRVISLSEKETQLLAYLMSHAEQLLTHEQIYQHLWTEHEAPNSNVLAALIRLLRRKIEGEAESPLIHTVYGKGYRFGEK